MSYQVYTYGKSPAGEELLVRQADIGWEYYDHAHKHWRKANNQDQAIFFCLEDALSNGRAHHWRYDHAATPMEKDYHPLASVLALIKDLPQPKPWTPETELLKPKSRLDRLATFLTKATGLRLKLEIYSAGSKNVTQAGKPRP